MRIFNQDKTKELTDPDLTKGRLDLDTLIVDLPAVEGVEEEGHWEIIAEYPNGGKDAKWVVDKEGVEAREATTTTEEIQVYIPYTDEELLDIELNTLRSKREVECFPYINRGNLWYETLTDTQTQELKEWYQEWLDVTTTKVIPNKPEWLMGDAYETGN